MEPLIVNVTINAPIEKVWAFLPEAEHIVNWNFAHESWHCPKAENNRNWWRIFSIQWLLKISRQVLFSWNVYRDYSASKIEYHIEDGRKVECFS